MLREVRRENVRVERVEALEEVVLRLGDEARILSAVWKNPGMGTRISKSWDEGSCRDVSLERASHSGSAKKMAFRWAIALMICCCWKASRGTVLGTIRYQG